jgi:hypothetical protein
MDFLNPELEKPAKFTGFFNRLGVEPFLSNSW